MPSGGELGIRNGEDMVSGVERVFLLLLYIIRQLFFSSRLFLEKKWGICRGG